MSENWCECKGHRSKSFSQLTDYYCRHFIPTGWSLQYSTLDRPESDRLLYLTGKCGQCGGYMRSGVGIASNVVFDGLLKDVCLSMLHHRSYDGKDRFGIYRGGCSQRSEWYWNQDQLTMAELIEQFTALFLQKDRPAARRWAEEYMPEQPARRETSTDFFNAVVELVKSNGFWPEQSAFITCEPARPSWPPDAVLCHPRFTFRPVFTADASGELRIDCCLDGIFDRSGHSRLVVGTIKTAHTGRDACLIMGALTGALLYYGEAHREANLDRYRPDETRKLPQARLHEKKGD